MSRPLKALLMPPALFMFIWGLLWSVEWVGEDIRTVIGVMIGWAICSGLCWLGMAFFADLRQ